MQLLESMFNLITIEYFYLQKTTVSTKNLKHISETVLIFK